MACIMSNVAKQTLAFYQVNQIRDKIARNLYFNMLLNKARLYERPPQDDNNI